MVFRNNSELMEFLWDKTYRALRAAQGTVYEIIKDCLHQFYEDYDPVLYERTEQLLCSLVRGDITPSKDGWVAEIYFDLSSLNYVTGAQPSGKQVMDAAANGGHGAEGLRVMSGSTGVGVWYDPLQVLDQEAIRILRDRLIEEGITIK